jgi:hypothetical protein
MRAGLAEVTSPNSLEFGFTSRIRELRMVEQVERFKAQLMLF